MGHDRLPYKMYAWSISVAGGRAKTNVQNWAVKTQAIPENIGDPAGGLSVNEVWGALAKLELLEWRGRVHNVQEGSESGGRLKFYRKLKLAPSMEQYIENCYSLNR